MFKLVIHPVLAYAAGRLLGLEGHLLFAVVVIAALPTATGLSANSCATTGMPSAGAVSLWVLDTPENVRPLSGLLAMAE